MDLHLHDIVCSLHTCTCTLYITVTACIYVHVSYQVNRINPSGDVERGQGLNDKELEASLSSSLNSVGLVNFGRTPVQVYPLIHPILVVWDMHKELLK